MDGNCCVIVTWAMVGLQQESYREEPEGCAEGCLGCGDHGAQAAESLRL